MQSPETPFFTDLNGPFILFSGGDFVNQPQCTQSIITDYTTDSTSTFLKTTQHELNDNAVSTYSQRHTGSKIVPPTHSASATWLAPGRPTWRPTQNSLEMGKS